MAGTNSSTTHRSTGGGRLPSYYNSLLVRSRKVDDWEYQVRGILNLPDDHDPRKEELKKLLDRDVTSNLFPSKNKQGGFYPVFNELLLKALDDGKTHFAVIFIESDSFEWNFKSGKHHATVLHHAVKRDRRRPVFTLIQKYRDAVDERDKNGQTPLHYAARRGHSELTALLLEFRSNINARDHKQLTPLHLVAWIPLGLEDDRRIVIATVLLDRGARINTRDDFGMFINQVNSLGDGISAI